METPKFLPLFILLVMLIVMPFTLASLTLNITVETNKLSYYVGESVDVYGDLTLDGSPVQNELVALEVHDPNNTPVVTRTAQTDTSGVYNLTFELSAEDKLGTYTVYVSSSHQGENATNNTTFELLQPPSLGITVKTSKPSYLAEESISVKGNLTLDGSPVQDGLIALEVHDPNGSPIVTRSLQTSSDGTYRLDFYLSSQANLGTYTAYVSTGYGQIKTTNSTTFEVSQASILSLFVDTDKKSYRIGENVGVYGNLALDGSPVQNGLVAMEIQDSNSTPVVVRVLQTDSTGTYNLTFKLPQGAKLGNYTIYVSSSHVEAGKATNSTTFEVIEGAFFLGDINGDGAVNILDAAIIAVAWKSQPGDPRWNPDADINNDNIVDLLDAAKIAVDWGKTI